MVSLNDPPTSPLSTDPMGVADEIWQAFLRAHPEAAQGRLTLEQMNQKMASFMQARNQQPLPDFEGLSPQQMHTLLNDPWASSSPLRLAAPLADSLLDQIPFFVLLEILYQHLLLQPIKLTPKGNLPLALCRVLYEQKLLVQADIEVGTTKKISEDNVAFLQALKGCLLLSPYVKKRQNTLSLTKVGEQALAKKRSVRLA